MSDQTPPSPGPNPDPDSEPTPEASEGEAGDFTSALRGVGPARKMVLATVVGNAVRA